MGEPEQVMRMRVSHKPSGATRHAARPLVLIIGGKYQESARRMTIGEARHLLATLTAAIDVAEGLEKVKETEAAKAK